MRFIDWKTLAIFSLVLTLETSLFADWPQFRGPNGQGNAHQHAIAESFPLRWSETKNIAWKTAIPGVGWSSPVIGGDQIWLTTAVEAGRSLRAICVNRVSGEVVQNIGVFRRDEVEHVHSQNSHATPTPIINEGRLYVHFGRNGTACLSLKGNVLWRNDELNYSTPHGSANSPVIAGDLLIICADGSDRQFVVALDKQTGAIRWRRNREHLEEAQRKSSEERDDSRKGLPFIAFSTPLVIDVAGQALLVSTPADHVVANRVDTGEEVWWLPYNCFSLVARPVFGNGLVYAIGGLQDGHYALYAIRPDGRGRLGGESLAWVRTETIPQVPSPLLIGKRLFLIKDSGIATCLNAISGEQLWQKRLGGNYRASPISVGQNVYVCSQEGKTTVIQLDSEYRAIATNQLDGVFLASPAISGNSLFLRSDTHLYKIATKPIQ